MTAVGVLGLGTYLPPEIRTNDWWPADAVESWRAELTRVKAAIEAAPPAPTEGARRALAAQAAACDDPFDGARERHVLAPELPSTDMEEPAARLALARAGVDAREIDVLMLHAPVPEVQLSNAACPLHHRLGLRPDCLALEVHAAAYGFLAQLALAAPLIETGRARRVLLVQSALGSRLLDPRNIIGARLGDAATAVVLGEVADGYGVLGASHTTDGRHPRTLIASAPGQRWYDGRSVVHLGDPAGARATFLASLDDAAAAIDGALAAAGVTRDRIDVFASHQANAWMPPEVAAYAELGHARAIDQFARTGYVYSSSVPLVLDALAPVDGERVLILAGGVGMVRGAAVLRWGRGPS